MQIFKSAILDSCPAIREHDFGLYYKSASPLKLLKVNENLQSLLAVQLEESV